ncbi:uncharacterized protein LOC115972746 [Quercus lobata]|uniref:uncharacterized protein LOC115972746 n=1 Tax=Quercus lobata TaxID=97700 RepID=UPI0012442B07|nr:uncharacterized protein LOC115972746 [Quercus lobata]
MATTNNAQEEEPPRSTTLERQVQTLMTAVERLTKQNHDLEEQLRQRDAGPNLQEQNQEGNSAERREQERPEGNNAPSRPERQNVSLPSLMDFAPPPIIPEMQAMKEQMEVMMNALKGRVSSDLDDLVNRTDSPFTTAFPTTLKGPAKVWFSRLTPNSINTFKELSAQLTSHFIGEHRYKRSTACLMSIKQREDEMLRAYITRFNKEALSIDEADDKILVAAFTSGLRKGKFLCSLYKNDPKTMTDVLYRATKYMNAEDALLACEEKPKKRERQDTRQDRGRKVARTGDQRDEKRSRPPTGRFTNFTPLTAPIDQVLMQIKNEGALTFPGKLKGNPNKRPRDKYCRFHRDHGHDTANCYDLKQQIEALIRQGKLQRFASKERIDTPEEPAPRRENEHPRPLIGDIRMIVGGTAIAGSSKKARKTYLRMVHSVQLTGSVPKMSRIENPVIKFSEDDAWRLHHPHDDALVVSLQIGDYNMHWVLVDNGSSADILYYLAFQQMRIDREWLFPKNAPLVGFGGTKVIPLGTITLAVTAGDYPQQITKEIMFLVVD